MDGVESQVIRLTLQARLEYLPGAIALVHEITSKLGLPEADCRRMELVVEEACLDVIQNSFEDEAGSFDIIVSRPPGQIAIAVEDRGLPLDLKRFENGQESGLGLVLMKAFADEINFVNLGRGGKRVEMIKHLPEKSPEFLTQEVSLKTSDAVIKNEVPSAEIEVRLMRPEESANLARCAFRCYGFTYSTDNFYYPERVSELVRSGLMISAVALDASGQIIGHASVTKEKPDSPVGEAGGAIVDPRCRGGGVFKRINDVLFGSIRERGMLGTFAEAVTVHPYSQKVLIYAKGKETGLLIGFTPATMFFKAIQGDSDRKRRAVLFFYTISNPGPLRQVYLPHHHAGMLRRIFEHAGLPREYPAGGQVELAARSQINIKVQTEASRAFLRVVEYGQDLEEIIRFRLKELCTRRIDCIYLDLPLTHPAVRQVCASMELLGFFFGSVIPEINDGDLLRLQYINNAELELQDIQLATDFGRDLLDYVMKASGLH